jgi:hypothetical protein
LIQRFAAVGEDDFKRKAESVIVRVIQEYRNVGGIGGDGDGVKGLYREGVNRFPGIWLCIRVNL